MHRRFIWNTLWEMSRTLGMLRGKMVKLKCTTTAKVQGPFFIRLIFRCTRAAVIWATEQHVNSPRFLAQDEDEEELGGAAPQHPQASAGPVLGWLGHGRPGELLRLAGAAS